MLPHFNRNKRHYKLLSVCIIICLGAFVYFKYSRDTFDGGKPLDIFEAPNKPFTFDPKNATYEIDGQKVTLANGRSEAEAAPGSASKIVTEYFGNEAYGDVDGDDDNDFVYFLTQSTGGTGTFYYAVAGLREGDTYKITNAVLVGDRIAPQTIDIKEDSKEIHVNFAERKKGEPMTAEPTVGTVLLLKISKDGVLEGLMR